MMDPEIEPGRQSSRFNDKFRMPELRQGEATTSMKKFSLCTTKRPSEIREQSDKRVNNLTS